MKVVIDWCQKFAMQLHAPRFLYHHMYVGGGYPPKFKDFRILCKPLKIKFWALGRITIFFAVKFREDRSNREICSSLVVHFQAFSDFSYFLGGYPPPKIMKNTFIVGWSLPPENICGCRVLDLGEYLQHLIVKVG